MKRSLCLAVLIATAACHNGGGGDGGTGGSGASGGGSGGGGGTGGNGGGNGGGSALADGGDHSLGLKPAVGMGFVAETTTGVVLASSESRFLAVDSTGVVKGTAAIKPGTYAQAAYAPYSSLSDDLHVVVTRNATAQSVELVALDLKDGGEKVLATGPTTTLLNVTPGGNVIYRDNGFGQLPVKTMRVDGSNAQTFGNLTSTPLPVSGELLFFDDDDKAYLVDLSTDAGAQLIYTSPMAGLRAVSGAIDRPLTHQVIFDNDQEHVSVDYSAATPVVATCPLSNMSDFYVSGTDRGCIESDTTHLSLRHGAQVDVVYTATGTAATIGDMAVDLAGHIVYWAELTADPNIDKIYAARIANPLVPVVVGDNAVNVNGLLPFGRGRYVQPLTAPGSAKTYFSYSDVNGVPSMYQLDLDAGMTTLLQTNAGVPAVLRGTALYFTQGNLNGGAIYKKLPGQAPVTVAGGQSCQLVDRNPLNSSLVLHTCPRGVATLDSSDAEHFLTPLEVQHFATLSYNGIHVLGTQAVLYQGAALGELGSAFGLHAVALDSSYSLNLDVAADGGGSFMYPPWTAFTGNKLAFIVGRRFGIVDLSTKQYHDVNTREAQYLRARQDSDGARVIVIGRDLDAGSQTATWVDIATETQVAVPSLPGSNIYFSAEPLDNDPTYMAICRSFELSGMGPALNFLINDKTGAAQAIPQVFDGGYSEVGSYAAADGGRRYIISSIDNLGATAETSVFTADLQPLNVLQPLTDDGGYFQVEGYNPPRLDPGTGRLFFLGNAPYRNSDLLLSYAGEGTDVQRHAELSQAQLGSGYAFGVATAAAGTQTLETIDFATQVPHVLLEVDAGIGSFSTTATASGLLVRVNAFPAATTLTYFAFADSLPHALTQSGEDLRAFLYDAQTNAVLMSTTTGGDWSTLNLYLVKLSDLSRTAVFGPTPLGFKLGAFNFGASGKSVVYTKSSSDGTDTDLRAAPLP